MTSADEWFHTDGTECVAGHDPQTRECAEGGGTVFPRGLLDALKDRMMPRPDGPTLVYVTRGPAPMVCQIDVDNFDPGVLPYWDLAVCKALLDLALTKIEQHERDAAAGVSRMPEADRG